MYSLFFKNICGGFFSLRELQKKLFVPLMMAWDFSIFPKDSGPMNSTLGLQQNVDPEQLRACYVLSVSPRDNMLETCSPV